MLLLLSDLSAFRPVYGPKDFLDMLTLLKNPNLASEQLSNYWGLLQLPYAVKSLSELVMSNKYHIPSDAGLILLVLKMFFLFFILLHVQLISLSIPTVRTQKFKIPVDYIEWLGIFRNQCFYMMFIKINDKFVRCQKLSEFKG